MSESVLSTTLPTATNAKGVALKSRKSFCIYIKLIMHTTTAGDTSSPLWMVRTLDNSVGVAAACGLLVCSCFCTGDSRTFSTAKGGLFVFCGFSACRQAGADEGGGECPRACSRRHCRQPQTQRAQPGKAANLFVSISR